MKKFIIGLLAISMLVIASAAMAAAGNSSLGPQTTPVNLTVSPYVFAQFADSTFTTPEWNSAQYGVSLTNNKAATGFNITIDGNNGELKTDTVNIAWVTNGASHIGFALDKGAGTTALPGTWTMIFDGAGVTGTDQLFITSDTADWNKKLLVPVTLQVTGIDYHTATGIYSGTMKITTVSNP